MKRTRNKEEQSIISNGNSKSIHQFKPSTFFKLILSPSQFIKLSLPENFARAHRDKLSTVVILRVPSGETQKVALCKEDNKLWFRDGWQAFVEHYSIDYTFFLLFKYDGDSNFDVNIFDPNSCEISYQCSDTCNTSQGQQPPCPEESSDLEESPDLEEGSDLEENPELLEGSNLEENLELKEGSDLEENSDLGERSELEIIHLDSDEDTYEEIQQQEQLQQQQQESLNPKTDEEIVNINKDVPFEYPQWLEKYSGVLKAAVAAGISLSGTPFFVTDIKSYALSGGLFLYVPAPFGRDLFRSKTMEFKFVKLEEGGKQWTVRCIRHKCSTFTFGTGWIAFAREVGLGVGDVCVFELTDANNSVLKVQIAKRSQIKAAVPPLI